MAAGNTSEEAFVQAVSEIFERYALDIMYGGNILIGKDIEDEYKDLPAEEGE